MRYLSLAIVAPLALCAAMILAIADYLDAAKEEFLAIMSEADRKLKEIREDK